MTPADDNEIYSDRGHQSERDNSGDDTLEFRQFCVWNAKLRQNPGNASVLTEVCFEGSEFDHNTLIQLLSITLILGIGVLVRECLRRFLPNIPYTVAIFFVGLGTGRLAARTCPLLENFVELVHLKPQLILSTFLPILIFESGYSINIHVFRRTLAQILLLAGPGLLFSTVLTAAFCGIFLFIDYKWNWVEACLFGSIISATDPVAVVGLLRELGAPESLSVLIEGESLLNDGIAVLLYKIFEELLIHQIKPEGGDGEVSNFMWSDILVSGSIKFLLIAVGGPLWGFIMARITILFFSFVFNDAIVEVSLTLASAYLTFFIGEEVLGVSGILAVVLLALTLKTNSTCISPQSEEPLKHFWEVLGYICNTLLFFLIGLIIGRKAFERLEVMDFPYLFGLYAAITLIRFLMLLLLKPLLRRIGYGFGWKTLLVVGWGGLRGAVGLCLALEVYEEPHFCDRERLGPKVLFHTAGIVLLTLLVNATTTKKLMKALGLTSSSAGLEGSAYHIQDAFVILERTRRKYFQGFQYLYPEFAMADWASVKKFTVISVEGDAKVRKHCPDQKTNKKTLKEHVFSVENNLQTPVKPRILEAVTKFKSSPALAKNVAFDLGVGESQEFGQFLRQGFDEENRTRLLKAFKISFRRQYEQGVLQGVVMKFVLNTCDRLQDLPSPQILTSADIMSRWSLGRNFVCEPFSCCGDRKIVKFPTMISQLLKGSEVERVHLSLEAGKGFVSAVDSVNTLLPRIFNDAKPEDLRMIKRFLEREKYKTILQLGSLQVNYPRMVAAAKTKYAARIVLNQMKGVLVDVRRDGLIEGSEADVLMLSLEALGKRLDKCPKTIGASSAETILDNLSWFRKLTRPKISLFLKSQARLLHFLPGDVIYKNGDLSDGIYLIITGLAKVRFYSSDRLKMARERYGMFPICELLSDLSFKDSFSDLLGTGSVFGELGYLKEECRSSSVTCETFLTTYFFSSAVLAQVGHACLMSSPSEDFSLHLWACWGSRVSSSLCQYLPKFADWSKARVEGYMEGGLVLPIRSLTIFEIPSFISDAVVIEGYFEDVYSKEMYIAPCLIPKDCNHLFSKRNPLTINRLMVITHEDVSADFLHQYLKTFKHSMYTTITNALGELEIMLEMEEKIAVENEKEDITLITEKRMDPRQRRLSMAIVNTSTSAFAKE